MRDVASNAKRDQYNMKYQIIILFLTIFANYTFGQRFVLPENEENFVYESQGSNINKIQSIDFPITKQLRFWENNAFCLDTANSQILIADLFQSNINEKISKVQIPNDINPISISVFKDNIFVGGDNEKEKIYCYSYTSNKWTKLDIPTELAMFGKSVDDFMITGDTLIAVDNIVMPKYLLYYDIQDLKNIKLIKSYTVPPNGSYETLFRGLIYDNYFVILSSTYGGSGSQSYLTVLKRHDLPNLIDYETKQGDYQYKGFSISNGLKNYWHLRRRPNTYPNRFWLDIVEKDGKILIAESPNRIATLVINENYFKPRKIVGLWYNDEDYRQIIDKRKLRYKRVGNKNIKWFVKIPDTDLIYLIYLDKENNYKFKEI